MKNWKRLLSLLLIAVLLLGGSASAWADGGPSPISTEPWEHDVCGDIGTIVDAASELIDQLSEMPEIQPAGRSYNLGDPVIGTACVPKDGGSVKVGDFTKSGRLDVRYAAPLTATPAEGYRFVRFAWLPFLTTLASIRDGTLRGLTPFEAGTVIAYFEKIPAPEQHRVTVDVNNMLLGVAWAEPELAAAGETVRLYVKEYNGSSLAGWQTEDVSVGNDNSFVMPDHDVSVTAMFSFGYTLHFEANGGSGSMADVTGLAPGLPYVLPKCGFTAPEGQQFSCWRVEGTVVTKPYRAPGEIVNMISDVTVSAVWEPVADASYNIYISTDGHGTAYADKTRAKAGENVYLTANPGYGYRFKEWQTLSGGVSVFDGRFTMPAHDVELKAVFTDIHALARQLGKQPSCNEPGYRDYYKCINCGALFEDAEGSFPIEDFIQWKYNSGMLYPLDHCMGEWKTIYQATETKDGLQKRICQRCGYEEYRSFNMSPRTGDESQPALWTALLLLSAAGIAVPTVIFVRRKKNRA